MLQSTPAVLPTRYSEWPLCRGRNDGHPRPFPPRGYPIPFIIGKPSTGHLLGHVSRASRASRLDGDVDHSGNGLVLRIRARKINGTPQPSPSAQQPERDDRSKNRSCKKTYNRDCNRGDCHCKQEHAHHRKLRVNENGRRWFDGADVS